MTFQDMRRLLSERMPRKGFYAVVPALLLMSLTACTSTNTGSDSDPNPVSGPIRGDLLYAGNRIGVVFSGIPNKPPEAHDQRIRDDGFITAPYIGTELQAAGRTIGDLQSDLQKLYVPAYFKTVTITVRNEEMFFFVGGEVRMPGQIPYLSEMTVLKAIKAAGDFTDFANRGKVYVTRVDGRRMSVNCRKALKDSELDLEVYPGDIIHVPRSIY